MKHSHGFIHANFYKMFKRNDMNVYWVNDEPINFSSFPKNTIIICGDMASNHLPFDPNYIYIGHNMYNIERFKDFEKKFPERVLTWRFYTRNSFGSNDSEGSIAKFDKDSRTLYQPYGTPINISDWVQPLTSQNTRKLRTEYWFGSIWNNDLNQGNSDQMKEFRRILQKNQINFRKLYLKHLGRYSISDELEKFLISRNPIAAAIHGGNQIKNDYYACRLFKSVSFGRVPVSNRDTDVIFGSSAICDLDIENLVGKYLDLSQRDETEMTFNNQKVLTQYTYEKSLSRFLRCINNEW